MIKSSRKRFKRHTGVQSEAQAPPPAALTSTSQVELGITWTDRITLNNWQQLERRGRGGLILGPPAVDITRSLKLEGA